MPTKKTTTGAAKTKTAVTKNTAEKKKTEAATTKTAKTAERKTTSKKATKAAKPAASTKKSTTKKPATKKTPAKKTTKSLNLPDDARELSEQQLTSMPESMYMNQLQLDFFKLKLESMRAEIVQEIAAARDRLKAPAEAGDEVDMAAKVEAQQVDIRIVERKTKLLVNVENAIKRILDNDYGYCIETGEPIGVARLLVRPTATLCITSKEIHEAKERLEEL